MSTTLEASQLQIQARPFSCKYNTTSEYNKLANNCDQLLVVTYNIRRFHKHIDEFHSVIETPRSYPNVVVLTKT